MKKTMTINAVVLTILSCISFHSYASDDAPVSDVSTSDYASYVTQKINQEAEGFAAANSRQEQVEINKNHWSNSQQNGQLRLKRNSKITEGEVELPELATVEQREINESAILAVYDTNNNGELNEDEQKIMLSDRQKKQRANMTSSHWQKIKFQIESNEKIDEAERAVLIEIVENKIEAESAIEQQQNPSGTKTHLTD